MTDADVALRGPRGELRVLQDRHTALRAALEALVTEMRQDAERYHMADREYWADRIEQELRADREGR
jgi:uncharacterized lipoprotein YmbA